MLSADENGVLARVHAAPGRRLFAYAVLVLLGALLIYLPLVQPPALLWTIAMVGGGAATLWMAELLRRGSRIALELTETELRDSTGRRLALVADIKLVDRGTFAFKPTNGFTLVMVRRQPRAWVPGVWWRLGRRIGVGGVTSASQGKLMAEQIAMMIRDA